MATHVCAVQVKPHTHTPMYHIEYINLASNITDLTVNGPSYAINYVVRVSHLYRICYLLCSDNINMTAVYSSFTSFFLRYVLALLLTIDICCSEQSIASARASVMVYDDVAKKWIPSGSSSGLSKVHIFQHQINNSFRVVGRKLQDHEVHKCFLSINQ